MHSHNHKLRRIQTVIKKGFALILPLVAPIMLSAGEQIMTNRIQVDKKCVWETTANNTLLKYTCNLGDGVSYDLHVKPIDAEYVILFKYSTKEGEKPAALIVKADGEVMACALEGIQGMQTCTGAQLGDPTVRPTFAVRKKNSTVFLLEGETLKRNLKVIHKDLLP